MAIQHDRDFDPAYGECTRLSPSIRRVVAKNPNPFTFTGTGVYLIGSGEVAVIDPGPTLPEHLDAIEAALDTGETIGSILVTHTHTDHTAGVADLVARTGATTYGFGPHGDVPDEHPMENISFDEYFTDDEKAEFKKQWDETPDELRREGPDVDFVPDERVEHGDVISVAGVDVSVVHTPGHTSNHVCFGLDHEGTLFTGDHVMAWATSVISPPDGDLVDYLASLEVLLERDDQRYWPTHGPAVRDPAGYVGSFIEHRRSREAQIVEGLRPGPTTIKDLVPSMYAEVDKRLWRAAANSVYSHLLALLREERATVVDGGEPSVVATWALV